LRLHLQPFGVTPEQARDYMRIALVPQLQLNPLTKMTIDEIQRASNAVSHLPPQHLDHLTAQAKAAGPADRPTRQTLDLSHLPAVARFKMDPAPPVRFAQLPQLHIDPGDEKHRDPFKQPAPKPADQQSDLAKKTADYAAQGHPSHRVPDIPDSERAKAGGVDDLIDAVEEALGLPKISGSFERTAPSGPADPGENKGTFTVGGSF
jgi:hypothetical protein